MLQIILLYSLFISVANAWQLVREYSGQNFFNGWDFYGSWDNLTQGNVTWVSQSVAASQDLAYVNNNGHAILKVDNTTNVPSGGRRNSIRITSQDTYALGSLWIIDLDHIPYGCSVWPAFWTFGPNWPEDGEIDIIEGINLMSSNQMALHTTSGCTLSSTATQLGTTDVTDCSSAAGCTVTETSNSSYGSNFEGGVWATQFDSSGIFIWFWSRSNVPSSITGATSTSSIDPSSWGTPHANYSSSTCNIEQYFSPQNLVLDITLCGDWAGLSQFYSSTCGNSGPTGNCYQDCVVGPGSPRYDNAYFDISYIRAYSNSTVPTATGTSGSAPATATATTVSSSPAAGASGSASSSTSTSVTPWGTNNAFSPPKCRATQNPARSKRSTPSLARTVMSRVHGVANRAYRTWFF
ncbi:glycoside hydrolase family 16 protein [Coniophora puteana RWD-64-598 SS2]|uniref:Glycoside hydrolase family 16 protein n=1 Tax=Coniophora puteana (strain RWD-64-598) TaxID=741705 RepID=A0A5M3MD52_CONPW|nr:glycoside hydrolase family 16 protein [Coniophora puteana RWD-64-598 SS2]EIW77172.1 glycoside hydrolase family 16 protein [Coniophora puteana RWD-64-598 SS2]